MTKIRLKNDRGSPQSRAPDVRRNEAEMSKIIGDIRSGFITIKGACFKYGLCRNTLKLWISKLSIRKLEASMSKKHFKPSLKGPDSKALERKVY